MFKALYLNKTLCEDQDPYLLVTRAQQLQPELLAPIVIVEGSVKIITSRFHSKLIKWGNQRYRELHRPDYNWNTVSDMNDNDETETYL